MTIDTVVADGVTEGDDGDDEPQPNERPSVSAAKSSRIFKDLPPAVLSQMSCPAATCRTGRKIPPESSGPAAAGLRRL